MRESKRRHTAFGYDVANSHSVCYTAWAGRVDGEETDVAERKGACLCVQLFFQF